jgi:hypothetical protein
MVDSDTALERRGRESTTGVDALALKPSEHDLSALAERPADALAVDALVVDYEGQAELPDEATMAALAERYDLRVTTPVRADGFDPLGDDGRWELVPAAARRVLVAGHGAYLDDAESARAVAPRLGAAVERTDDPWVGTESVERVALATGATQFELLGRSTDRAVRALRAAGFDGDVALYAPTVLSDDEDEILDTVGDYVARRGPVRAALPDGAPTDAEAAGRAREVLSAAARDFALVGDEDAVRERIDGLRSAGVTAVVGYPAGGLDRFET